MAGYLETPQTLEDIYKGSVGAFVPSMQALGRQQERDSLTQADQQRMLDYNMQADPQRLRQLTLGNDTTAAQLPGITAQSSITQRKDREGADTYDSHIKELLSQNSAATMANHVKEMQGLGDLALTHSAAAFAEPFGAAARTKKAFEDTGHGDFWNPEWDTMDVSTLGDKLNRFGRDVHESSAGYQKALDAVAEKTASAEKIAAAKNAADLAKQREHDAALASIAKFKSEAMANPKNLEGAATQLLTAARIEQDPIKKAALTQAAQDLLDEKARLAAAAALTTQSGAVDLPALGKPGQTGIPARGPVAVPPRPGASAASAPQKFEEGKIYQDAQGNKAKFVNGQWVPA